MFTIKKHGNCIGHYSNSANDERWHDAIRYSLARREANRLRSKVYLLTVEFPK